MIKGPLGKSYFYTLQTTPEGRRLVPATGIHKTPESGLVRGIINPRLFDFFGKKLRMAFLNVHNRLSFEEETSDRDFETLSVMGQFDLVVTHLNESLYEMIFEITEFIPFRPQVVRRFVEQVDDTVISSFPFFEIDTYHKILGVPVTDHDRSVFGDPEKPVPSVEELTEILKLAKNWDDSSIDNSKRDRFLQRRWLLDTTTTHVHAVSSIVTISLDHAGPEVTNLLASFDTNVVPVIVENPLVSSVYGGRGQNLSMHYIVRVDSELESLMALVSEIQGAASKARLLITTSTHIVVRKLSSLSLEKVILTPRLPTQEIQYRNKYIIPNLSKEDRTRVIYLSEAEQRILIHQHRKAFQALEQIAELSWFRERSDEVEKKMATGLLHKDFFLLREVHDFLQVRVEVVLKDFLEKKLTVQQFESLKAEVGIPLAKRKDHLTLREKISLGTHLIEETTADAELSDAVRNLAVTLPLRNAFAHADWGKITVEMFVDAVPFYSSFLSSFSRRAVNEDSSLNPEF